MPMFEAEGHIKEGKAVGKIGGAVEWIDIPAIGAIETGAGAFFAKDPVIGKLLVEPANDELFRSAIGLGYQVNIAFVFRGNTAVEITAQEFAGLERNARCAGRKTKIKLRWKVAQGALLTTLFPFPASRRPRSLIVRIWCL